MGSLNRDVRYNQIGSPRVPGGIRGARHSLLSRPAPARRGSCRGILMTGTLPVLQFLMWLFILGGLKPVACGAAQVSREYELKAVFLYNFAGFTTWPASAFATTNAPLVIGVLGDDPFGGVLEQTVRGEKVFGHPLKVQHFDRVEEIKTCHILFVSQSKSFELNRIVSELKGRPILTVSDISGAERRGVMIRLLTESNRIHFRVDLDAVRDANLTLSSKLLRLADVIDQKKP